MDLSKTHDVGNGPFPNVPMDIFTDIGMRLILLQDFEMYLTFVTKVVYAEDSSKVKDAILKADVQTMGAVIKLLRKKVSIKDDFDLTLKRTLKARNQFVHEFSLMFNLRSQDGISNAMKFLINSFDDLAEVTNIMKAVIISYSKAAGIDNAELEYNWKKYGDFDSLESKYVPQIEKIFTKLRK